MSRSPTPWNDLLATAARSPSPHNAQPWKVRVVDDRHAELLIDRRRALPDEDTTGCFMICAMGIFTESLQGIAATRGYRLEVQYVEPSFDDELNLFARLTLIADATVIAPFPIETYTRRKTSRLPNLKKPIPGDVLASLTSVDDDSGQRLSVISDRAMIQWIMDLNLKTTFVDMNNAPYRREFHNWVRTNSRKSLELRDGLDSRCMNLSALEFWMNANFYWTYRIPVVSNLIKLWYDFRIGHIEHFGIITGSFWDYASASSAGRYLIKLWLRMAEADIMLHPFGNLVTNLKARRELEKKLDLSDIWLVFRMGYTNQAPGSYRLDVSEIVID